MPDPVWDPSGKTADALKSIVSDFGTRALSTPSILENVLHDLLPDSPRQVSLIVAAGGSSVAASLQEQVGNGMDPETAVRLAAAQLAEQTPFDAAGCRWVVVEFARALGHQVADSAEVPIAPTPAVETPGPAAPVMPASPVNQPSADKAETVLPGAPGGDATPVPATPVVSGGVAVPRRRRRTPMVLVALLIVLGALVGVAAGTHFGPFKPSPSSAPLRKLLPDDVAACTTNVGHFKFTGMTAIIGCNVNAIGGLVFSYQFDNQADFQTSLASFNKAEGFAPGRASGNCPPNQSDGNGVTTWHSHLFPPVSGQKLECYTVFSNHNANDARATYVWEVPSEFAFFQAVTGRGYTMNQINNWWVNHAGPFHK
ncbi:MAG: hypothetical protein ACRDV6_00765 [Acidimicrobiales bacterium]